jgi:hypothetical protein
VDCRSRQGGRDVFQSYPSLLTPKTRIGISVKNSSQSLVRLIGPSCLLSSKGHMPVQLRYHNLMYQYLGSSFLARSQSLNGSKMPESSTTHALPFAIPQVVGSPHSKALPIWANGRPACLVNDVTFFNYVGARVSKMYWTCPRQAAHHIPGQPA